MKNYEGKRFGKLVVKKFSHKKNNAFYWNCVCDCGNEKILKQNKLLSKNTRSCGCLFKETHRFGNPIHNLYHTRIYSIWTSMKRRCYSKKHVGYEKYGGRGITMCDEWLGKNGIINFYNWSIANGYQDNLSIDRIDNNGNYEPSNCRWVDRFVQQNNTRKNKYYEYDGEKLTLSQLSRKYNINKNTLMHRLKKYSVKDAIERPIDKSKRRKKKEEK